LKRSLVVCSFNICGGGGGGGESSVDEAGEELGVEKAEDGVVDPSEGCGLMVFMVLLETRLALSPPASSSPLPLPSARPSPAELRLETGLALLQSSSLRRRKSSRLTGLTPSTNSSWRSSKTSTTRSQGVSDPPKDATVDRTVSSEHKLGGSDERMRDSVWVGSVEPKGGAGVGEGDEGREAEARGIYERAAEKRIRMEMILQEWQQTETSTDLLHHGRTVVRSVDIAHAAPMLPVVVGEVAR
jgi:hypothetical protein